MLTTEQMVCGLLSSSPRKPLAVGERYGDWVIDDDRQWRDRKGHQFVIAVCRCGYRGLVWRQNLLRGGSTSCRKCSDAADAKRRSLVARTNPLHRRVKHLWRVGYTDQEIGDRLGRSASWVRKSRLLQRLAPVLSVTARVARANEIRWAMHNARKRGMLKRNTSPDGEVLVRGIRA